MSSRKAITVELYDSVILRLTGKNLFKLIEALIEKPRTVSELKDILKIDERGIIRLISDLRLLDLIRKEDWIVDEETHAYHKRYHLNKTRLRQHIKRIRELVRKYSLLLKK